MKKNQYDNEQPRRRFNEKTDGEMVRRWFALMPTKDLAHNENIFAFERLNRR